MIWLILVTNEKVHFTCNRSPEEVPKRRPTCRSPRWRKCLDPSAHDIGMSTVDSTYTRLNSQRRHASQTSAQVLHAISCQMRFGIRSTCSVSSQSCNFSLWVINLVITEPLPRKLFSRVSVFTNFIWNLSKPDQRIIISKVWSCANARIYFRNLSHSSSWIFSARESTSFHVVEPTETTKAWFAIYLTHFARI